MKLMSNKSPQLFDFCFEFLRRHLREQRSLQRLRIIRDRWEPDGGRERRDDRGRPIDRERRIEERRPAGEGRFRPPQHEKDASQQRGHYVVGASEQGCGHGDREGGDSERVRSIESSRQPLRQQQQSGAHDAAEKVGRFDDAQRWYKAAIKDNFGWHDYKPDRIRKHFQEEEDEGDGDEEQDFAEEPDVLPIRNERKPVGRNEPCPCGSGKKYKKCHGANA